MSNIDQAADMIMIQTWYSEKILPVLKRFIDRKYSSLQREFPVLVAQLTIKEFPQYLNELREVENV